MIRRVIKFALPLLFLITTCIQIATATPIQFQIDTSSLAGTQAQLAFDFIDGGAPSNSVSLTQFTTNGTLGLGSNTGSVIGNLSTGLTFSDTNFFNEYLTSLTLGTSISFLVDLSNNGPNAGSFPDSFSFYLLDPKSGLSLVDTTDPTGGDALFAWDIDGTSNGTLSIFPVSGGVVSVTASSTVIPEPQILTLLIAGFIGLGLSRRLS